MIYFFNNDCNLYIIQNLLIFLKIYKWLEYFIIRPKSSNKITLRIKN